jgi:hypothetical protein
MWRMGLTRTRSATADESERGLQWTCFHNVKLDSTPASGWLHRLLGGLTCTPFEVFQVPCLTEWVMARQAFAKRAQALIEGRRVVPECCVPRSRH